MKFTFVQINMKQVLYLWGFGDLGRMAIYFQGAGEHWLLFSGIWEACSQFQDLGLKKTKQSHLKGKAFISFDF